jgi:general secretion pathway protein C
MRVDDNEVVSIRTDLVILRPPVGSPCTLGMYASAAPEAPPVPSSIVRTSDHAFTIDRELVRRTLADPSALTGLGRALVHEENGRAVGVKLYGIRRNSILGQLGIQNGDMVRTVNGRAVTSLESAIDAYAQLRNEDRITIELDRRGSSVTIEYSVR